MGLRADVPPKGGEAVMETGKAGKGEGWKRSELRIRNLVPTTMHLTAFETFTRKRKTSRFRAGLRLGREEGIALGQCGVCTCRGWPVGGGGEGCGSGVQGGTVLRAPEAAGTAAAESPLASPSAGATGRWGGKSDRETRVDREQGGRETGTP